jgi:hypothetical protein
MQRVDECLEVFRRATERRKTSRLPGTRAFERHIPPALEMLDRALSHLYTLRMLQDFVANLRRIEDRRSEG